MPAARSAGMIAVLGFCRRHGATGTGAVLVLAAGNPAACQRGWGGGLEREFLSRLFVPSKLGEFERMDLANERLHAAATSGDAEQLQVT